MDLTTRPVAPTGRTAVAWLASALVAGLVMVLEALVADPPGRRRTRVDRVEPGHGLTLVRQGISLLELSDEVEAMAERGDRTRAVLRALEEGLLTDSTGPPGRS